MRSGASYSTWFNGNVRTTGYFHNQIGILTETIGNPTPVRIPFLPNRQLPNGDQYELRFRAPDAGANSAALGRAESAFTDALQTIRDIVVSSGSNLQGLDLPIDPNGVVYDSIRRAPVAGVTLTLLNASGGAAVPSLCFDDPTQQGQVTRGDGYYKFDLNFSQAGCPSGANYLISIVAPGLGFVAGQSQIIPPSSSASTAPFSVPACLGGVADAILATTEHCEAGGGQSRDVTRTRAKGYSNDGESRLQSARAL